MLDLQASPILTTNIMQYKTAYIWGLLSRFAPQAIYLGTTMMLSRYLTPDDFGQIGVLSIIFVVANVLLDAGLGGSLVKEKEISDVDCSSIFIFNMFVSLSIYAVLFISSGALERFFGIEGLSSVICTISLVFPFSALGIVPKALLNRNLQFRLTFYNSLVGVIVGSSSSILVAKYGGGVYALVVYQVVTVAITGIANYISSRYKFVFKFSINSLVRLLPFGVYTTIISIADTIYENLITSITGKYMSVQQAGYLYQAKRIEETMTLSLTTTINTVSFPILTRLKDDHLKFVNEADTTFKTITCLVFPLLSCVASFAELIITLLFGNQWLESVPYLEALAFAGSFIVAESLIRNFVKSLCNVKQLLYVTLAKRTICVFILFVALIIEPRMIIYAYIFTSFIGYVANLLLYNYLIRANVLYSVCKFLLYILPSIAFYIIMKLLVIKTFSLVVQILIAVLLLLLIYFVILRLYGMSVDGLIKSCKK